MICVDYHEEMGKRGFTCKVWIRIVKKKKKKLSGNRDCHIVETGESESVRETQGEKV